ncbi:MAG: ATP-dependent metallopeptidase FtsH/Yme1/Tma family protein [Proteobacteria bacterium]|nr:ATP-dependent metallopeptidase FtsH/Yme1/Tma family protein [Pseudomonadota bacterium]
MNNNFGRNLLTWIGIIVVLGFVYSSFVQNKAALTAAGTKDQIAYSDFMAQAQKGDVSDVVIKGQDVQGHFGNGTAFSTMAPDNENIVDRLAGTPVKITVQKPDPEEISAMSILLSWFPMLLLIGVWVFFMRQMQGKNGGGVMGFGKSRARMLNEETKRVTFEDVAGIEEAKEELKEVVDFLKDPKKFQRLGGKIPKGALLVGPPGTGKTLVARAVAGEAGVPFFSISGSDFVEMFVGVGASRVRDMFEQGKKNAPCIIFIDEIDAVGRHRGAGLGGGNDEREQTLNQLLVEMDGFEGTEGVIIIAATNRPDVLDPALLRPGRFDRQITIPNPDVKGREKILKVHARNVPLARNVDLSVIARGTPGFSGADLANLINEAALLAARRNKRVVGQEEFEDAKDKVMMGAERRSMAMSDDEKKLTAYHEAGHAVVTLHEPQSDPIHKATIVPRGRALGMVMRLPQGDRLSLKRDKLLADLAVAMGGRVAEEIIFGADKVTTGASGDIRMATDMARRMVTEWGMSDKLGMIHYGANQEEVFLGHSVTQSKNMSEHTAELIDIEIKRLVQDGYERAKHLLTTHLDELHKVAQGLLEYEMLSGDEIKALLRGEKIVRQDNDDGEAMAAVPASSVPRGGAAEPAA